MGCRSFLNKWVNEHGEEVHAGRMNLGVISLNTPRIGIESEGNVETFWELFNERLDIVHEGLQFRIKRCKEAQPKNAPMLYKQGAFGHYLTDEDTVDQLFDNERATVSIGYIGLYETMTALFGNPNWETNKDIYAFSIEVVRRIAEKAEKWSKEEEIHYSLYATPSESMTDRFCRLDTAKFGIIKDITDKGFYVNSFHLDTRKDWSPMDKIDFESPYPKYSNGGFIHYVEAVIPKHNLKAMEQLWDYSYDKLGYFGVNTPIDKCLKCGFEGDFHATEDGYECPECGNNDPETCDVVKRLCGLT